MNEKLNTIIKYLQAKNTAFSVSEINEISAMLQTLIVKEAEKSIETPKE